MLESSPFCVFHNLGSFFQCLINTLFLFIVSSWISSVSCLVNWATHPVRQQGPSSLFFCALSIELLWSPCSPCLFSGPPRQKLQAVGVERSMMVQRREVQRPCVMSKPSSGSPQSPGSLSLSLFRLYIPSLLPKVLWDKRKRRGTLLPPNLFVSWKGLVFSPLPHHLILCIYPSLEMLDRRGTGIPHGWHTHLF